MLEHNIKTYEELKNYTNNGKNCCVVNPCGSGKTSIIARYIKDNSDKKIVLVTHQGNAKGYYHSKDSCFNTVKIVTYNKLHNLVSSNDFSSLNADTYIFDEAHYMGAKLWSKDIESIISRYNPLLIGVTATVQRLEYQGTEHTIVDEFFNGNSAGNFTSKNLQKVGVFQEPEYVLSLLNVDELIEEYRERVEESYLSDKVKNGYYEKLDKIEDYWSDCASPEKVLKEKLPSYMYKKNCNRIVVYARNIEESYNNQKYIVGVLQSIFKNKKITSYVYNSKVSESVLKDFLKEDDSYIKVIVAVNKFSETLHLDDLYVAIMMRPSISNIVITQQFGRLNNIGSDKKPIIFDFVNNLSVLEYLSSYQMKEFHNRKNKDNRYIGIKFNISYIKKFQDVFKMLDKTLKDVKYYEYDGFRGTLRDIAKINFCISEDLINLVESGVDLEDAVSLSQRTNIQFIHYKRRNIKNPLTDEQRKLFDKYKSTVDRFVKRRGITDDDIVQELYYEALYIISEFDMNSNCYLSALIINAIKNRYIYVLRYRKYNQLNTTERQVEGYYEKDLDFELVRTDLREFLNCLDDRSKEIMMLYCGFYGEPMIQSEIAKKYGLSKNRISQLMKKSLAKLRHPVRRKKLLVDDEIISDKSYTMGNY